MTRVHGVALMLIMTWLGTSGCASNKQTTAQPGAVDPMLLAQIRQDMRATDPGTVVGVVTQVLENRDYAAVSDLPLEELGVGQPMTFIDTNRQLITHGTIRRITLTEAHVEFEQPIGANRRVRVGDIAIRFKT